MDNAHRCTEREMLLRIEGKLDKVGDDLSGIRERLAQGDGKMTRTDEKVAFLEKVVYGTVGCVALGVLGTAGTYLILAIKNLKA